MKNPAHLSASGALVSQATARAIKCRGAPQSRLDCWLLRFIDADAFLGLIEFEVRIKQLN
ncbi:hypothetical protein RU07_02035 [Agrobacterium tumefaciens]|uniref:Uncharacterized protein n=1 Tax=Agrobacterium tumefaciens TaxID=358 RepID=A0A0D0L297_AGRTU|nr:hypothetical protein RU07_02035 [Agrobacterium tumefaciens]